MAAIPFCEDFLGRPDGHRIHYVLSGRSEGHPFLVLHGGPGSGMSSSMLALFDSERDLVIQFDQRGSGLSTPHASHHANDLANNTLPHLIDDVEALRQSLGIRRWAIVGTSWGVTLGLAYAQRNPAAVSGMVLAGVTQTRFDEIDWLYRGLGRFLPEAYERFLDAIPPHLRHLHPIEAYHALLNDPSAELRQKAADDFHAWEAGSISSLADHAFPQKWRDPGYRLARARICAHYFTNRAWLADAELLDNAFKLKGIVGYLIQGRLDLQAPPQTAYELAKAWENSELMMLDRAGHSVDDDGMADAMKHAIAACRLLPDGFVEAQTVTQPP